MSQRQAKHATVFFVATMLIMIASTKVVAGDIAFVFADTLTPSTSLQGMARARLLINNLQRVEISQSIFLVRTSDINAQTQDRVKFYDDAGQLLANAGATQSLLSRNTTQYLQQDLAKADKILRQYPHYEKHAYIPFLLAGPQNSLPKLQDFLTSNSYQLIYTSVQAQDEYLDQLFQAWVKDNNYIDMKKLQEVYVELVIDDIITYDIKASLLLGYSPPMLVLLHATDVTAYSIVGLVDALKERGYNVISAKKFFSDPITNPFFPAGYFATSHIKAANWLTEPKPIDSYGITESGKEKTHRYLVEMGLEGLLPKR